MQPPYKTFPDEENIPHTLIWLHTKFEHFIVKRRGDMFKQSWRGVNYKLKLKCLPVE